LLVHAVARLVLHPEVRHVQVSWVKTGADGVAACLQAGADDMGGVLMHESITRAAGGAHGQEMSAESLTDIARSLGRRPWQRSTLYGPVTARPARTGTHSTAPEHAGA
jgi:FO synthase